MLCANLLFGKMFAENCMKMKEFEPGDVTGALLNQPLYGLGYKKLIVSSHYW